MKKEKYNILSYIYQTAMLFGFTANVAFGPFTTRRLVLLIAIISITYKSGQLKTIFKELSFFRLRSSFFLFLGLLFLTLFNTVGAVSSEFNKYFTPRELLTLLISIIGIGLWCVLEIKTFDRFAKLVVGVVMMQSIFTFISAVYQPFRIYVAEHFMTESYVNRSMGVIYGYGGRAAGVGIAWSSGSLFLAYGCFLLISLKKKNAISMTLFSVFYAIIASATALMGRTGLIAELILLLYYGVFSGNAKNILSITVAAIFGFSVLSLVLSMYESYAANRMMEWMVEFMDSNRVDEINAGVVDDGFPPFSSDFVFGTGLELGHYKNFHFTADSGYIRSYTSVGVVGMFLYYVGMLNLLLSVLSKRIGKEMKRFIWIGIIILFAVEYKEPFVGMPTFPLILFTSGLLLNMDYTRRKNEDINSGRFVSTTKSSRSI